MCIAILMPKGTEIDSQSFRNCWDNNFNGAGFMYNDNNNKMHVVKEMDSFSRIYKKFKRLRKKFPDSVFMLHFRISTHGVINKENCHPFKVNKELGFIHNGVIHHIDDNDVYSDTNMFNREILRKIPGMSVDFMDNPAINQVFGEFIGHSKLVFMDNMNNFTIVNEDNGHWGEDGIWYSNESYKRVKNTVDYGGKTMTREELVKKQGGSTVGSSHNLVGYNNKSYRNTWGGSWGGSYNDNDYLNKDKEARDYHGGTLYDTSNYQQGVSLNSSEKVFESDEYVVSNGHGHCGTCHIMLMTGELTSVHGDCLECISEDKAVQICTSAVSDGCIVTDVLGSSVVDPDSVPNTETHLETDVNVDCDNCTSVVKESQSKYIPSWQCTLCSSCIDDFIDCEAISDTFRIKTSTDDDSLSA